MAKAVEFEWDYDSAGALLLLSPEIAAVCEATAEQMTRATGVEYTANVKTGKTRVRAYGYDKMSKEEGSYKKRKGDKIVYTQKKSRTNND